MEETVISEKTTLDTFNSALAQCDFVSKVVNEGMNPKTRDGRYYSVIKGLSVTLYFVGYDLVKDPNRTTVIAEIVA